ncbi:MAG TPA: twin-arginine translocase TatA/TatE family subunit [Acidimicrobiales bacterium]
MTANIFGPDLGIIVLVILVVVLGGSQLPKIARNVGTAGREFRKAQQEAEEEAERDKAAKAAREAANAPAGQLAAAPSSVPTAPASPGSQQAPVPAGTTEDSIQLTRTELDALLKAREEQVRGEGPTN